MGQLIINEGTVHGIRVIDINLKRETADLLQERLCINLIFVKKVVVIKHVPAYPQFVPMSDFLNDAPGTSPHDTGVHIGCGAVGASVHASE